MENKKLTFIDLFSGIGAFHEAISQVFSNSNCQYALDIDQNKNEVYQLLHDYPKKNILEGDIGDPKIIQKLTENGKIDLLCAGFPCQPYSKAGKQNTSQHISYNAFSKLLEVISTYNQNYQGEELKVIVLENVNTLITVENGQVWKQMKQQIQDLGYIFPKKYEYIRDIRPRERERERETKTELVLNPIDLGIPQNRPRLFLFAFHQRLFGKNGLTLPHPYPINLPFKLKQQEWDLSKWLEKGEFNQIEEERRKVLKAWEELIIQIPLSEFPLPLWLDIFLTNEDSKGNSLITFLQITFQSLVKNGKINLFNQLLMDITNHEKCPEIYQWKKRFAKENWTLYLKYQIIIDKWWEKHSWLLKRNRTYRKLELCVRGKGKPKETKPFSLKDFVIQFRHSGIRIRYFHFFPTITRSYSPIIVYEKRINNFRYLTTGEIFHLFGFNDSKLSPLSKKITPNQLFSYLGDSINVSVLKYLFKTVFHSPIQQSLDK